MSLTAAAPSRPKCLGALPALAFAVLTATAMLHTSPAHAARRHATATGTVVAEAPLTARRHRVARPKVQRTSSDESSGERDRRLARECRGRPNAGACLGFGG